MRKIVADAYVAKRSMHMSLSVLLPVLSYFQQADKVRVGDIAKACDLGMSLRISCCGLQLGILGGSQSVFLDGWQLGIPGGLQY